MQTERVSFFSEGCRLVGVLHKPDGAVGRLPVSVTEERGR